MNMDGVRYVRDRFNVPVADADLEKLPYVTFPEGSEEHTYLHAQRQKLHGYLPSRQPNFTEKTRAADPGRLQRVAKEQKQRDLYHYRVRSCPERDAEEQIHQRPPRADHRRRSAYFRYGRSVPSDRYLQPERPAVYPAGPWSRLLTTKKTRKVRSCRKGSTSWAQAHPRWLLRLLQHQQPADDPSTSTTRCRLPAHGRSVCHGWRSAGSGFLIGGTSGRTTLNGEGLQHEDGHSHIQSLTIPNCISL